MGRRKVEIKYIENITKREATYSNRRSGILKKANDLTILCDAQVFLLMFPKSGTNAEYTSPSTTMKEFFDRYEKKKNVDLSASEDDVANSDLLQSLQNDLREQKEINKRLRKKIGQRTGQEESLNELSYGELLLLEEDLRQSLDEVRFEGERRRQGAGV
ncbi:hypothetical protein MKW98_028715 [Papaver atlanticum]|uniref:MADS-box domain-containing protein n=1 Tax=Papaver atlanticum TaxID=357466 RepID=A0AAD4SGX1_9MAGN|nr:hypothetical protein MKW98_028715 [Papaver atlanticum]